MSESFKTLRRLAANEIEPGSWFTATSSATGTATSATFSELALTRGDASSLESGWGYWTAGALLGQQRPVLTDGLTLTTGAVEFANAFSATTPSGAECEFHLRYPVKSGPGTPWVRGYLEMMNDALRRLWFEDDISVTATGGATRYLLDTTTHPWLANRPKRRVLAVIEPVASDNVKHESGQRWWIDDDAEAPALVLTAPFANGDTFYLRCARPAHTRIKTSGTWGDSSTGFANDSDEAHVNADDVLAMVITQSMNALGMRQPAYQADVWEDRRRYWASVASASKFTRLPRRRDGQPTLRAVGLGGGLMGRQRRVF